MSTSPYYLLAQIVAAVHLLFILYVALGGLLCLRWPRTIWFHLPVALWGGCIELIPWTCPLTPLEKWLLLRAGQPVYPGSFSEYHLFGLIYPSGLTRFHQIFLGVGVLLLNAMLYGILFRGR